MVPERPNSDGFHSGFSGPRPETPLAAVIRDEVLASSRTGTGPDGRPCPCILFRDYMALCLYHPDYGYYRSGPARVGRGGDFYTSPLVGDVMGRVLAGYIGGKAGERFGPDEAVDVIDWGGGIGRLAAAMLDAWEEAGVFRFRVTVVDSHPVHRRLAEEALAERIRAGAARVIGAEEADAADWSRRPAVIVANELLDAFPVRRLVRAGGRLREWGVRWDGDRARPAPCLTDCDDEALRAWLEDGALLREGQTAEACPDAEDWLRRLTARLGDALLILIDYGDETEELLAPYRMEGTLACYRRHTVSGDPYAVPGEQDITAHVNFTRIRKTLTETGWEELWRGTQKAFLAEHGALGLLQAHASADPFHPAARRNRAVARLLVGDGMGEVFKVNVFGLSRTGTQAGQAKGP